jgi:hypothetical protein
VSTFKIWEELAAQGGRGRKNQQRWERESRGKSQEIAFKKKKKNL